MDNVKQVASLYANKRIISNMDMIKHYFFRKEMKLNLRTFCFVTLLLCFISYPSITEAAKSGGLYGKNTAKLERYADQASKHLGNKKYDKAISVYLKIIGIFEKDTVRRISVLSNYYCSLAQAYRANHQYEKAEKNYLKAIDVRQKEASGGGPDLMVFNGNLGFLYYIWGKYDEAEYYLRRSLDEKGYLGLNVEYSIFIARTYEYLANIHMMHGKYDSAETFLLKAIKNAASREGLDKPWEARLREKLATSILETGAIARAKPAFEQVITLQQELYSEGDVRLMDSYTSLAILYGLEDNYIQAEALLSKVISLLETENPRAIQLPKAYSELAGLYNSLGKVAKAESLYIKAINLGENILGNQHPVLYSWLGGLAGLYAKEKNYEKAEKIYSKVGAVVKKTYGENSFFMALNYNNIGVMHLDQLAIEPAEQYISKAIKITEKIDSSHVLLSSLYGNQAVIHIVKKEYDKVDNLLLKAIDIASTRFGANHKKSISLKNYYIQYLHMLGKKDTENAFRLKYGLPSEGNESFNFNSEHLPITF